MNNQPLSRVWNVVCSFQFFARLLQINAFAGANWCAKPPRQPPFAPSPCLQSPSFGAQAWWPFEEFIL